MGKLINLSFFFVIFVYITDSLRIREDNGKMGLIVGIEVFSGSPWEAEIIKGLLESNDIRCVIKDGIMGTLAPYIAPSVSVLVTEDQYEAATELIRSRNEKDTD